nr:hypothetical protein [Mesobacillus harenae]
MSVFYLILLITAVSMILCLRKKRAIYLTIPVFSILLYFIVQVAMVPAPFMDTVRFIFSLV